MTTPLALLLAAAPLAAPQTPATAPAWPWPFVDRGAAPEWTADAPDYARMLFAPEVDLRAVERAFDAWYADAPPDLEDDPWARFFVGWHAEALAFADDDGRVRALDTGELLALRERRAALAERGARVPAAGAPTWSFVGPRETRWRADHDATQPVAPWQVNVYCVAVAPSDPAVLYCGSETGALYKSVDEGHAWQALDFNWGRALLSVAVHPSDPDVAYAATATDVFRTADGGVTWTIVLTQSGLSCNALAIRPDAPDTVLAASANGLLVTTDAGATWTPALPDHVDDVAFRPGDGSTAYALARDTSADAYTFYKSTDGGASFAPSMAGWGTWFEHSGGRLAVTPADPDLVAVLLLTYDGAGSGHAPVLLRSDDAAASWSTVVVGNSAQLPMNNGQGYYDLALAVSHTDRDALLVGTTTAYRSVDGGASWTAVGGYTGPFAIHPDVQAIVCARDGAAEHTWIATDGGLSHSSDFFADPANFEARIDGLDGTAFWGFSQGWNEDALVGGRYHNGNTALYEEWPAGQALRLGGAESVTGWMLHGRERYAAFADIAELVLPRAFDAAPEGSFLFTKHPGNYYYGDAFSPVRVDYEDFLTVTLCADQTFWRSRDGGATWQALHTFAGQPYHFDVSRADRRTVYLAGSDGFHRSPDGGETFEQRSLPAGLTNWHAQNLRVAASASDPEQVWILNQRASADSTVGRVFVSHDGGATWTDLTTPALAGRRWTAIAQQAGTDGGVYVASARGEAGTNPARVFYRDAASSDWVDWSAGLPQSASPIKLLPFYRDAKLRWGGNRGAWEVDLAATDWAPLARPFVGGAVQPCARDVVELDSYSVCKGSASYQWSVPGAAWTSALDQREVQALFPEPGTYVATLTVTQDGQTDAASVQVVVTDECGAEPAPGNALALAGGASDYAATLRAPGLVTNTLTLTAWIRREGDQADYAGLVFHRAGTASGLDLRPGEELGYHWAGGQWGWSSGLVVPDGRWAHVALVVTPDAATLYLDGVAATHAVAHPPAAFDGPLVFGADPPWSARRFQGRMDEVCLYDRALSQAEVREAMHLTRDPAQDPHLVGYWQWNRAGGVATDRAGTNHATLLGAATRVPSTAPVGAGASARRDVFVDGTYDFGATGLTLTFAPSSVTFPAGELCVTRLDRAPDGAADGIAAPSYWVVRGYGANASWDAPASVALAGFRLPDALAAPASAIRLFARPTWAEGATWAVADHAEQATPGAHGSVTFGADNGQTGPAQLHAVFRSRATVE